MNTLGKLGLKLGAVLIVPLAIGVTYGISGDYVVIATSFGTFGSNTTGNSDPSVAIGDMNSWDSSAQHTLTVGSNLTAYEDDSLVVGTWNLEVTGAQELFVVGVGTGSMAKANALEVHDDGTVRIGEQGDLSMGAFGQ